MKLNVLDTKNNYIRLGVMLGIFLYCCLCYSIFLLDKEAIIDLASEDGAIEYLGALYFFISSILFLVLFRLSRNGNDFQIVKTKKNIFYLLFCIMFLFAAGEEVSWGQRIFHIAVPNSWEAINVQKEFNIHNLRFFSTVDPLGRRKPFWGLLFNMNHIFTAFSLGFCFLVPFLNRFVLQFSRWRKRLGLPLVPLEVGAFFIAAYLIDKIFKWFLLDEELLWPNQEIRENIWAFLYLVICIHWIRKIKDNELEDNIFLPTKRELL